MIFGLIYCIIWILILFPLGAVMSYYVMKNKGGFLSSNFLIFFFLSITLTIRGITLIPILTDENFDVQPTSCQEAIFEFSPLVIFLMAVMANTYRFYIIKKPLGLVSKILWHLVLWSLAIGLLAFNILSWVQYDYSRAQRVLVYLALGIYSGLNIIWAIVNLWIMIFLLKRPNMLLIIIIFVSFIGVISILVYTIYRGNNFGPLTDFEFMLMLSFTELIPVLLIVASFIRYMWRDGSRTEGNKECKF